MAKPSAGPQGGLLLEKGKVNSRSFYASRKLSVGTSTFAQWIEFMARLKKFTWPDSSQTILIGTSYSANIDYL